MRQEITEWINNLTLEEKAGLCQGADFWHTEAVGRLDIPGIMMCDGPHGLRKQNEAGDHMGINDSIQTVCFPSSCATASSFDVELMEEVGMTLGEECRKEKVGMLLGPGINIKRSPLCGRNFEYFSEDPYLAGKMASAYVKGLQSKGIAACVKHFAANNQETRRMTADSVVDERTLYEIYLSAFEMVVKEAAPKSIMCAYNRLNGIFASENRNLLTGILRERWGFCGLVVTDWGAGKNPVKGIQAGLDLTMPGPSADNVADLVQAVKTGLLEEKELDGAVQNVLQFVLEAEEILDMSDKEKTAVTSEDEYQIAKRMAEECAVLLKNERETLPLREEQKIAFIGEFASKPRYQGAGSSHINSIKVVSAVEASMGKKVIYAQGYRAKSDRTDDVLLEEARKVAREADVAVIFAGLPEAFEAEGIDRRTIDMPQNQNELIYAVAQENQNTVVVLHNGSAVAMPWINKVPAVLEMHLAGDAVGEACVNLLYGKVNPCGKLAETFPERLSDNPSYLNFPGENGRTEYREGVFVGYRYYDKKDLRVLFPFGHGLSYTSFRYEELYIDKKKIRDTEQVTVTVKISNMGRFAGKEVIQLYVSDAESIVNRPVRELKGFAKAALEPGESRKVEFTLDKRAFAYYEPRLSDWYVESGIFRIEAGSSSRDIRLTETLEVEGTVDLPVYFDENSTIGEILATEKGQRVLGTMLQKVSEDRDAEISGLGEGSEEMVSNMYLDMPIGSLRNFAGMTKEQLEGLLEALRA